MGGMPDLLVESSDSENESDGVTMKCILDRIEVLSKEGRSEHDRIT